MDETIVPAATREVAAIREVAVTEGVVEAATYRVVGAVPGVEAADLFPWPGGRMCGGRATLDLRMQRV